MESFLLTSASSIHADW